LYLIPSQKLLKFSMFFYVVKTLKFLTCCFNTLMASVHVLTCIVISKTCLIVYCSQT